MERLRSQRGQALPMALGMILVLSLSIVTVIAYTRSAEHNSQTDKRRTAVYSAAESSLAAAISKLANTADPWSTSALPACTSPTVVNTSDASGDYCGSISGNLWTIQARGWTGNASFGGGNVAKTITATAEIRAFADGGLGQAWNRIGAETTSQCTVLKKLIIPVPFSARGCVDMQGATPFDSRLTGSLVQIGGYVKMKNGDGVGYAGTPIERAEIAGTCTLGGNPAHTPCTSADNVFANTITTTVNILPRPVFDFAYWYANAKPGPLNFCTTGGLPGGKKFDKNTTYDNNNDLIDLTPAGSSYDCQYWQGGVMVGQLAWNHTTKVMNIKGSIFFDGDIEARDDAATVNYNGKATIFASGKFHSDELFCAGGDGTNNCRTDISNWDPTQNLMILVTGGKETGDSETLKFHKDGGGFQGALWGNRKCKFDDDIMLSTPILCDKVAIKEDTDWSTVWPWPPSLIDQLSGQVYTDPGGDFQILLMSRNG